MPLSILKFLASVDLNYMPTQTSELTYVLQILTLFEKALRRDFLSSNFSTTDELLGSSSIPECSGQPSTDPESVAVLPWVPLTTAALSLRLFEIDSSISYVKPERLEPSEEKEAREYIVSLKFSFILYCF